MFDDIKTACLYVRYSSVNQTEQSIEGQTRVCQEFAERHGIRIVEIYADRATSASKDIEKRVNFLKMIKDSEKNLFDAVIVYKLDRFSRSRYDMATYKYRLRKNGVQVISATENISNDPEGIILESVLEGMAEFYSAELSQKITRGLKETAFKHNTYGGQCPLGYKIVDKKFVIDEETAPLVREAFSMCAEGHTIADICRSFNARGFRTSKGARFGKSSFMSLLHNERYIGVYKYGEYRAEGAIPAIIDKETFTLVQERIRQNRVAPGARKAKAVYLLSGKLFCGHCGSKMNANSSGDGYRFYDCYGRKNARVICNKRNMRKDLIEKVVVEDALSLLTDETIEEIATVAVQTHTREIEQSSNIMQLRTRLHETKVSLDNLTKAIESGLAPQAILKRMSELEDEQNALETAIKKETLNSDPLEKEEIIYWLEQFRQGDINDENFLKMLIDLFVQSVTVWDEDGTPHHLEIAYNLTSMQNKTYPLNTGGTSSDIDCDAGGFRTNPRFVGSMMFRTVYWSEPATVMGREPVKWESPAPDQH